MTEPGTLDEAWKAAEAALPDRAWVIGKLERTAPAYPAEWWAYAYRSRGMSQNFETRVVSGPTPAAALLALAAALRAVPA